MNKWFLIMAMAPLLSAGATLRAAEELHEPEVAAGPWFTGPLIAPLGVVVPYGDVAVRSYLYFIAETGAYGQDWQSVGGEENFYTLTAQFQCFFGLTPWCDLNIIPRFFYKTTSNQHFFYPGDLTAGLDFQLMKEDATPYFPGIKFAIREIFPTGNFQYFHPRKLLTDETGEGTFSTQFDLVFYKIFHWRDSCWLSMTWSAQYTIHMPAHVHGFNTYGGGFGTDGKVLVGSDFQGILSFELSLNQNWAFALDSVYRHGDSAQFFGMPGIAFTGTFAEVGRASFEQLSFAPAIEYNFSKSLGVIVGCWFSAAGRNSPVFRSGVVNFQYVY